MDIDSTKSEISEIRATPTVHTLVTHLSSVTQVVEGLQRDVAASEAKREAKAVKSRIQKGKDEKRDKAEQKERREVTQNVDKEEAEANRRKDKEEAEERNKIARKEVEDRINKVNKRSIEQT